MELVADHHSSWTNRVLGVDYLGDIRVRDESIRLTLLGVWFMAIIILAGILTFAACFEAWR